MHLIRRNRRGCAKVEAPGRALTLPPGQILTPDHREGRGAKLGEFDPGQGEVTAAPAAQGDDYLGPLPGGPVAEGDGHPLAAIGAQGSSWAPWRGPRGRGAHGFRVPGIGSQPGASPTVHRAAKT